MAGDRRQADRLRVDLKSRRRRRKVMERGKGGGVEERRSEEI
jgi:hypothetical protein